VDTLELSVADLLLCRFAISAVGEVVEIARAIADPAARAAHGDWLRQRRTGLQQIVRAYDLRPLFALTRAGVCVPDFLRPTPVGPVGAIERELEQIRATPAERVHTEIERCVRAHVPMAAEVERALFSDRAAELLAELLAGIWSALIRPTWPQIQGCLERDILYQSRTLARRGLATVLEDVAPSIALEGGHLLVHQNGSDLPTLEKTGMLLVPSTFIWPRTATLRSPPGAPLTIRYPARGVGALWAPPSRERDRGLRHLIGKTRAQDPRCSGRADAHNRACRIPRALARKRRRSSRRAPKQRPRREGACGLARDLLSHLAWRCDVARRLRAGAHRLG
jgi:Family of unknown function (DUF5937)